DDANPTPGSLRWAIQQANAAHTGTAAQPDVIAFNLSWTDPNHFYYRNQVSLAAVAPTNVNDDTAISDIAPAWRHSWWTITPPTPLPPVPDIVPINGYTQGNSPSQQDNNPLQKATANTYGIGPASHGSQFGNGDDAVLRIELNGSSSGGPGLSLQGGNSTVE